LDEAGFKVIAVSDSKGGMYSKDGIHAVKAMQCKMEKGALHECVKKGAVNYHIAKGAHFEKITNEELLELPCDILVLSAFENQVTKENASRVKAKLILELANGPITPEADEILEKRKITVIPDILANAGGVTVSYFELVQNQANFYWSSEEVQEKLGAIMVKGWERLKEVQTQYKCTLRMAAFITALSRLATIAKLRGVI